MSEESCPRCVLVIEDDADIRDSVREVIEQDGYEVLVAADGNEALELLNRAPRPVLVLVDLVMPGMDGRKLLRYLESQDRLATLPIVVFTATKELGDSPSSHPVLKKPTSLDALLQVVRAHCCSNSGPDGGPSEKPPRTTDPPG